jgi:hypothetical protein
MKGSLAFVTIWKNGPFPHLNGDPFLQIVSYARDPLLRIVSNARDPFLKIVLPSFHDATSHIL